MVKDMTNQGRQADVLIIGAGTSGGVAAKHLAEAGFKVTCLEQGGRVDLGDLPGNKPEYELIYNKQWHPDPNVRQLRQDYPIDDTESKVPGFMYNAIGGSSILYGAVWPRALPSDFRVKTLDGVADDWPISYDDLLPFYEKVDQEFGASGLGGNTAYPNGGAPYPPLPGMPIHKTGRVMAEGLGRLGWHWWPGINTTPTRAHNEQKQCVRLGICRMGCPHGAKGSTDVTHWPAAMARGAEVITNARVAQITLDSQGRADGAVYIRDNKEYHQKASLVILAANGIGTPRVLLMSASARFPDGLANSSGLVGKRLMLHPYSTVVGLYDDDLDDSLGPGGEYINSLNFYETDTSRGFVRGAKWGLMPSGGPLTTVMRWMDGEGVKDEDLWGPPFAEKMRQSIGRLVQWIILPEDLPEDVNSVSLNPDVKDSDGLPAAKMTYRVSDNTKRMTDWHIERALESHEAAGAVKSWVPVRNYAAGHNTGTAKMGSDREDSVVNEFGQAHDVPNLYVIDGSVFTTSTGVNPTPTICALAKRTATYLTETAHQQEVSS